ncbi:MAG: ribonuclease J [Dehalococcoidia bacterium]|nr:ribonuclease J [Dehalococcoidia bacterium]
MNDIPLRVIPLGGLGEIGKNMMVIEYEDEAVVIDSGVLFPEENMPGVDFVIPDISYLVENADKITAILITHGHEDHIGALPYVLDRIDVPIYSSRLTHGLITVKLREHGRLADARLNVVQPYEPFTIGKLGVEFFRVCHSIPDAMGIAVRTPLGIVIHTGDFKVDHTPEDGKGTDFSALARMAEEGVLLLCSDSTYAEVEGYTPSERVVGETLDREIAQATGRVMVATFASLISRVQQVIDAAVRYDRKVTVVGRSMVNNVKMARNLGYLRVPDDTLVSMNEARKLPHAQVVIIATGAQGEPTSALVRIANGEHQDVEIEEGDTVIVSASPIPGNETLVARTIDNLLRQGAKVLYSRVAMVHVHGHASREELKMMLSLVKPRFFVPVHGEYRHLVAHAELAVSVGVPPENAFVLEDGEVLALWEDYGEVIDEVPAGHVYVDGHRRWDDTSKVLDERRKLASDGVVTLTVTLDKETGDFLSHPLVKTSGFLDVNGSDGILEEASEIVLDALDELNGSERRNGKIEPKIKRALSKYLYDETRMRPTIIVQTELV